MSWDHKQSVKEVARHIAFKMGAQELVFRRRKRRGFAVMDLDDLAPSERFDRIYQNGHWVHSGDQVSASGEGSDLIATSTIRVELPALLARLGCRKLLDVGCGDWTWMRDMTLSCDYHGVDISPTLIDANRRYERNGVRFSVADAGAGPLPKADVILCREVLFHLSFSDGRAALARMREAARWICVTSDTGIWFNSDIQTGDFRRINLQRPPYLLPPPHAVIRDDFVSRGRVLGVWRTDQTN